MVCASSTTAAARPPVCCMRTGRTTIICRRRVVCVAGNSIESPRLLGASSQFPNGLANSSGQVGRNFMNHHRGGADHPLVGSHVPRFRYRRGGLDEVATNTPRGFVGGYHLEGLALHLPFTAAFMKPGGWGAAEVSSALKCTATSCVWVCGEDLAQEETASPCTRPVRPSSSADPYRYQTDHTNDAAMRRHWSGAVAQVVRGRGGRVIDMPPYPPATT